MAGVLLVFNKVIPAGRKFTHGSGFKTIFKNNSAGISTAA
jgi:hypothetical protein